TSVFSDNRAVNPTSGFGGAIWVGAQAKLVVLSTRFRSNSAQFGGALYVSQESIATITGPYHEDGKTHFESNVVSYGGAGCGGGGTCSAGGAIYSEGDLTLNDLLFFRNQTPLLTPPV